VADEHKAIFDAALAREADLAVDLLTQHLEATARNLEAIAADVGTTDPKDVDAVVEDPGRRD
jgi:DNA-binding GntR family transcriptional regulator